MTNVRRMVVPGIVLAGILTLIVSAVSGAARPTAAFDNGALRGSYGSIGNAGAGASIGVGVAQFDGAGGVTRNVRVNAEDPAGGRRLLDLTSIGQYQVQPDGTGVIAFINTLADGTMTDVTFDFVITKSGWAVPTGGPVADEIYAVQREPGATASPVTELLTRRAK